MAYPYTKVGIYTRPDSSLSVVIPLEPPRRNESEDDAVERIVAQDVPVVLTEALPWSELVKRFTGQSSGDLPVGMVLDRRTADIVSAVYEQMPYSIILRTNVPRERTYRGAWELQGGIVRHNLPRAKQIHRDVIRSRRADIMLQLDGRYTRAVGQGNAAEAAAVEAKRQLWRDAPADPRIDAAQTIVELSAVRPWEEIS